MSCQNPGVLHARLCPSSVLTTALTQVGQMKPFTKVLIQFQPLTLSPAAELDRVFLQSGSSKTDLIPSRPERFGTDVRHAGWSADAGQSAVGS